jgi:hypothetical protein
MSAILFDKRHYCLRAGGLDDVCSQRLEELWPRASWLSLGTTQ